MTCVSGATAQPGEEYTAVWRLRDDDPPVQVTCVVRHVGAGHTEVEFVDLAPGDRLRIASYISARSSGIS